MVRRDVARDGQPGGPGPTDQFQRGGRRQVREVESGPRFVAQRVREDGEITRDGRNLGRGGPALQAEDRAT